MATKKTFYITTAIDYPNAEPHIGHAYQKIVADVLARWHSLLGKDVFFLTGTDEHGKKIQEAAEKEGKSPRQFVDEMSQEFKSAWASLNVKPNRFIRTTDKDHEALVTEVIKKCNKAGDIYLGKYEGWYCVGCEAYYTEKDMVDGKCPLHNRPLEKLEEESYFFKLSKYQKFLLNLYKKNPDFVLPDVRRNEMTNRIKEGLKDLSISRTSFNWGIPFPLDNRHIVYVWMDALFNYVSGAGKNQEYWPADIHLLGKDNGWFHSVYWPAFLKSAGYKLPKTVFIHGFLTFNGQKISKSLGNAISPKTLVQKYGADPIRYFVTRNFVFGEDGDFSEQSLVDRHNNELANKLGNLVSRVSALAETYGIEKATPLDSKKLVKRIESHFENLEFDKALNEIFAFIDICNEYIQNKKPWETKDKKVLYQLVNAIKDFTILLSPFIPETCEKIAKVFNFEISLKALKEPIKISKIKKATPLFVKIETSTPTTQNKPQTQVNNKVNKSHSIPGIMTSINYSDWEKIDLRVGKIEKVEDIEGADKLYKLTVNIGKENKTVCAGLKKFYSPEQLKGKKCILFVNLAPRMMRGIESQGMILAAVSEDESAVVLVQPEKDIPSGAKIR
ncbi:MAG: methionine--tRNA ligase [archaeon]